MVKQIIFIILLLIISSSITYAITSTDDYLECVTNTILENCVSVYEVQNFTKESIFNLLKNFENQLPKGNILFDRREVLICEIPNDFMRLIRYDANRYSLEYSPSKEKNLIDCPKIVNKNIVNQIGLFNFYNNINVNVRLKIIVTISFVLNICFGLYITIRYGRKLIKLLKK